MLPIIPYTYEELESNISAFYDAGNDLQDIGLNEKISLRWEGQYAGDIIAKILLMMSATKFDSRTHTITYFNNNAYRFNRVIENYDKKNIYGLIINQEAQTHFTALNFPTASFLQNAQEHMKQSSQHFLRIFTVEGQQALYVWTNKNLSIENLYKLFALLERLYPRKNEIFNKFIKACIDKDVEAANKAIDDYMNSDEIEERKFQEFKEGFKSNKENQIRNLRNEITNARNRINEYETNIAIYATKIRTNTENIAFLMSSDDSEDVRLIYKYLKKSPYISRFSMWDNGIIELTYHAPIMYFNDYPAEKMIEQEWRAVQDRQILKIVIGKKYTLWTKARLQFNTSTFGVQLDQIHDNYPLLSHPHINEYRCFGNHIGAIREAAESGNHLGAIEQITQAVLNLNFYDGCVIDRMIAILNNQWHCLPCWTCEATGEMLTTEQVVERGDYYEETQSNS